MAVQGFTVGDFLGGVNSKLRRNHAGSLAKKDKIAALEEGKSKIWRLLTATDNGWFVVQSQRATPANDDYFPNITAVSLSYDLPNNFHQMYAIDFREAGKQDVIFQPTTMREDHFIKKRRETAATPAGEKNYWYDIIGVNPAKLVLAQLIDSALAPLETDLFYVRMLDRWTAEADSVDDVILPFMPAVTTYAAKQLAIGADNQAIRDSLESDWAEAMSEIAEIADRHRSEPVATSRTSDFVARKKTKGAARH